MLEFIAALLAPVVAVTTTYIAYQQYRTNRDKLRLDLYEKRFEVYSAIISFISSIISSGTASMLEIQKYSEIINKGFFLFDKDLTDYLDEIRKKGLDLNLNKESRDPTLSKSEKENLTKEWRDLMKWFTDQGSEARREFDLYLRHII